MAEVQQVEDTKTFANVMKKVEARESKNKAKESAPVTPPPAAENIEEKPVVEFKEEKSTTDKTENKVDTKSAEANVDNKPTDKKTVDGKEEKPVAEETKKEAVKSDKKEWWEDDADNTTATSSNIETKKSEEIDYKAKYGEYESILKDPLVEAIVAAKKAGKSPYAILEELKAVDYDKAPAEELYKTRLQKAGATEEEITEALDEFRSKPKWQQNESTQQIRKALKDEQEQSLKRVTQSSQEAVQVHQRNVEKAKAELDTFISDLNDKEFYGLKITPEIAQGLKNTVTSEISFTNPDGTYNIPMSVELALWHKYKKVLMKANMAKSKSEGIEQVLKEVTRPSLNNTSDKRLPAEHSGVEDTKEARESYLKEKRARYNR